MNSFIKRIALAATMLCAVGNTAVADPTPQNPGTLAGAPAMVVRVDQASHTVVLRVRSTGHDPRPFEISRNCLFSGGLLSADNLFPNERVLIWTQSGQAGKLPMVVRFDRDQN